DSPQRSLSLPRGGLVAAGNGEVTIDTLVLELTHRCNLHCIYCFYEERLRDRHFLPLALIERFLATVPREVRLRLTGGEVFVHPEADAIISSICEAGFALSVTTNGTMLTEERIARLGALGVGSVNISFDGTAETMRLTRGAGAFERVLAALRSFEQRQSKV